MKRASGGDMFGSGGERWKITQSEGVDLVLALYVRDSCGLPADRVSVPALEPPVSPLPVRSPDRRRGLGAWWTSWWESLIEGYLDAAGPTVGRGFKQEFALFSAEFGVTLEDARRWRSAYRDVVPMGDRELFYARNRLVNTTIDAVATSLGRPFARFALEIVVIPVKGPWFQQVSPALLLVSQQLRNDVERFGAVLTEAILMIC